MAGAAPEPSEPVGGPGQSAGPAPDRTRVAAARQIIDRDGTATELPPPARESLWLSVWPWGQIAAGLLVASIAGYWQRWQHRPVPQPAGVEVAPNEPRQTTYDTPGPAFVKEGVKLTPRADFDITARVLGTERYRFDAPARAVPVDIGLGWGPMSDSGVLSQLQLSQSDRFLWWRNEPGRPLPLSNAEIITSATNLHPIAATPGIARAIRALRPGQIVRLTGRLVDLAKPDGYRLPTSLSRTDIGAGACEVMYVEALIVLARPPAAEANTVRGIAG